MTSIIFPARSSARCTKRGTGYTTRGWLQDIHWSLGGIGYFPTYTLGNMHAAQLFAAARNDLGDLDAQFTRGDFAPLKNWLNEQIHHRGKQYRALALTERVTGRPLS